MSEGTRDVVEKLLNVLNSDRDVYLHYHVVHVREENGLVEAWFIGQGDFCRKDLNGVTDVLASFGASLVDFIVEAEEDELLLVLSFRMSAGGEKKGEKNVADVTAVNTGNTGEEGDGGEQGREKSLR